MWDGLNKPWQESIKLAWDAYKKGTIPIGCVIVNNEGEIVSKGQNQIYDYTSESPLAGTNMAHAEMNALIGFNEIDHPEIKSYTLYTTMEPCPMCFGAAVMMNIRNIYYAADDGFAGATSLNEKLDYIKSKRINIEKVGGAVEAFQLILQSAYEYGRNHPKLDKILSTWRNVNNLAIDYGKELYELGYFESAADKNKSIEEIYNEVTRRYLDTRTCPICGEDNGCRNSKDCWCHNIKIPKELLDTLPDDKKEVACICKSCIDKYNSAF